MDQTLDQDVADWFATACDRPWLSLLGPVKVRAQGKEPTGRTAFYGELLAFLAERGGRGGVDLDEICLAPGVSPTKLRDDISRLRTWLGLDPRTGVPHLPARGPHGYRIGDRVLVDIDLFRRLRLRGQARGGAEGIEDLTRALQLASGRPFDHLHAAGWSWLSSGDRVAEHAAVAIADVAFIVVTDSLERGDSTRARAAADVAAVAAPEEEVTWLCRVRLEEPCSEVQMRRTTWPRHLGSPEVLRVRDARQGP